MSERSDLAASARDRLGFSRWWLVVAAMVGMAVVSPYQYVWSSIEGPLQSALDVSPATLGTVFTLFVVFQAGSQFPVGWWRDRHGPRALMVVAAVLAGGGYLGLAWATAAWQLFLFYSLGAIGVGIVYTVAVNTALKWFPDRRGLTTGAGTMAFAGGSVMFVPYVRANATVSGYPRVLLTMGAIIAAGVFVAALVIRDPPTDWVADVDAAGDADEGTDDANEATDGGLATAERQYTWREVLRTHQFWVMYGMFVAVSGAGLMLTAKVISFAQTLEVSAAMATLSATLLPVAAGVGRLVMGDISDRVRRERAMAVSFVLLALGLVAVVLTAQMGSDVGFVAAVVVATFFWSPQYTLFPSVVGDYYGREHSSANYALLYSGKMWGGVFGGTATGWLVTVIGWTPTFLLGAGLALVAGLTALILRPPG